MVLELSSRAWLNSNDPLELLRALPTTTSESKQNINALRAFTASCCAYEPYNADPAFVQDIQKVARGELPDQTLAKLRKLADRKVKQEQYLWPLERLCKPEITWRELCSVAEEIIRNIHQPGELKRTGDFERKLTTLLRTWLQCPWEDRRSTADPTTEPITIFDLWDLFVCMQSGHPPTEESFYDGVLTDAAKKVGMTTARLAFVDLTNPEEITSQELQKVSDVLLEYWGLSAIDLDGYGTGPRRLTMRLEGLNSE